MKKQEKLGKMLKKTLEAHLGPARAAELLGEVWLKAHTHLERLQSLPKNDLERWILRVARTVAADEWAREVDVFGRKWPRPPVGKVSNKEIE